MKFVEREDIEAPIEYVFSQISDFPALERSAMRRGAEVQRVDNLDQNGVGMAWDTSFMLRGKRRDMRLEMTDYDEPNCLSVKSTSANLSGFMMIDLVALSRRRTRLTVEVSVKPKTLTARLLLQSLKLARTNMTRRFALRVAEYAKDVEDRFKASA
ncbi:MAG: SRPBCC family protein [Pseudomonadota bacterium]